MLKSKINKRYEKYNCSRICQGDILKDFSFLFVDISGQVKEYFFPYLIVLSQDCDLQHGSRYISDSNADANKSNQYLPNILITPGFPSETARTGTHLEELFNIVQEPISKRKLEKIQKYQDERYHFLFKEQNLQIPDLLIDFKLYFTVSLVELITNYNKYYLATINELFRERFSQRFCNYLARIGTPEIDI